MMRRNLAVDLALPAGAGQRQGGSGSPAQQLRARDRRLMELVTAYRAGQPGAAGPLLDFLAPSMIGRLRRYREVTPAISDDDLCQQMVVEVLRAARSMPLRSDPAYLERRLSLRAGQAMRRMLAREQRLRQPLVELSLSETL
ncbi:MAG TPA: hypothetical protein VNI34_08620 [Candidatus Nitrosotalea sp.]|nr:hypothetical protein [Candidatus Nitrosotalea sp.]